MTERKEKPLPDRPWWKNPLNLFLLLWLFVIGVQFFWFQTNPQTVTYSKFLQHLEANELANVTITADKIVAKLKPGAVKEKKEFIQTYSVADKDLVAKLTAGGVEFQGSPDNSFFSNLLAWLIPLALLLLFWRFMFSRMQTGASSMLNFGKSKAKIYMEQDTKVHFADVAGVDEAKAELIEVVNFLKDPARYSKLGGRAPKGILLVGPPGTGKTLMARAVAGEAGVAFFSINGSEFVEMFVGMGAARVRDLFDQARKSSPCIIFIDELDALGKSRSLNLHGSGGNDEKEQTLNQLLAELDGFDARSGVVLLAATNRPEILDPALLRSGRFDRQILLDNPDRNGREQILAIHVRKITCADSVDLKQIASLTPGFSGADLANLVNEAALVATRRGAEAVESADFTKAIERIVAGLERKKRLMNPEEKKRVAYHEMGHATAALALSTTDQVHKVSIIPRGIGALGYTLQRPTEDRYLMTYRELIHKIAVLLGGRIAEQEFCESISTGASDDLTKATNIARAMVTQYGMSEKLGATTFERTQNQFLAAPGGYTERTSFSEKTNELIDAEISQILRSAESVTRDVIKHNDRFIESGVAWLLEHETIEEGELQKNWQNLGQKVKSSADGEKTGSPENLHQ